MKEVYRVELLEDGYYPVRGSIHLKLFYDLSKYFREYNSPFQVWYVENGKKIREMFLRDSRRLDFMGYIGYFVGDDLRAKYESQGVSSMGVMREGIMVGGGNGLEVLYVILMYLFYHKADSSLMDGYPLRGDMRGGYEVESRVIREKMSDIPIGIYMLGIRDGSKELRGVLKLSRYDARESWNRLSQLDIDREQVDMRGSHFVYEALIYTMFNNYSRVDSIVDSHVVRLESAGMVRVDPSKNSLRVVYAGYDLNMTRPLILRSLGAGELFYFITRRNPDVIMLSQYMRSLRSLRREEDNENYEEIVNILFDNIFGILRHLYDRFQFIHGDLHGENLLVDYMPVDYVRDKVKIQEYDEDPLIEFFDFDWSMFYGRLDSLSMFHFMNSLMRTDVSGIIDPVSIDSFDMSEVMHLYDVARLLFHNHGDGRVVDFLSKDTMEIIFNNLSDNWWDTLKFLMVKYESILKQNNRNRQYAYILFVIVDFGEQMGYFGVYSGNSLTQAGLNNNKNNRFELVMTANSPSPLFRQKRVRNNNTVSQGVSKVGRKD